MLEFLESLPAAAWAFLSAILSAIGTWLAARRSIVAEKKRLQDVNLQTLYLSIKEEQTRYTADLQSQIVSLKQEVADSKIFVAQLHKQYLDCEKKHLESDKKLMQLEFDNNELREEVILLKKQLDSA